MHTFLAILPHSLFYNSNILLIARYKCAQNSSKCSGHPSCMIYSSIRTSMSADHSSSQAALWRTLPRSKLHSAQSCPVMKYSDMRLYKKYVCWLYNKYVCDCTTNMWLYNKYSDVWLYNKTESGAKRLLLVLAWVEAFKCWKFPSKGGFEPVPYFCYFCTILA